MATSTTNYGLTKPASTDFYNVEDFNNNADIIDAEIKKRQDEASANAAEIDTIREVISITLTAAGWEGDAAPYTQTVSNESIKAANDYDVVSMMPTGTDQAAINAYILAYSYLCNGAVGESFDGGVTFTVFKKPTTDFEIGLKAR